MSNPPDRIIVDKFTPSSDEMQQLADLMVDFGLSSNSDIGGLIDDRFARGADTTDITGLASILRD